MRLRLRLTWLGLPALLALGLCAPVGAQPKPADPTFDQKIKPFLATYCNSCHNSKKPAGSVALDVYLSEAHARKDRKTWEEIEKMLASGEMPPKKSSKPRPTKAETEFVLGWIELALTKVDCTGPRDPGRVTLRRLNRAEYNNTIRDLCGVALKPADDFPSDDVGYGFDNIGDVLSLQPILLEKYLASADRVLDAALKLPVQAVKDQQTFRPQQISAIPRSAKSRTMGPNGRQIDKITFVTEGSAALPQNYNFTAEGDYVVRFRGWGTKVGGEFPKVALRVDGRDLGTVTVDAPKDGAKTYEAKGHFTAGEKRVAIAYLNAFEDKDAKQSREFGVEFIQVEGPFNAIPKPDPESVRLLLVARPGEKSDPTAAAQAVLANFARRAFRRPVRPDEVARLMKLFELATSKGEPFEQAIKLPMKAVLVSPHFLFRIEDDPKDANTVRTLNDFEFATRLSYFLWASMPDEELFTLAGRNELRKPAVLKAQIARMLKDPKASALTENFAGQWLQLRNLRTLSPDTGTYKGWNEELRASMIRESELFFENVVKNDRSVLEFLDADYTFLNGKLARHYGVPDVYGDFKQVKLPDGRRGGIVTQASVLTVTSNPTRTSPVKRGKWILENVLGTPPPPPAPEVPELEKTQLKGTLRQRMEQHRKDPSCANCHAKMDPLGFGLENFDGIGGWRDQDEGHKIDASGVLPDGGKFDGPAELRKVLLTKSDLFRRCLAEKLLTYALGRGLEYYDKCVLDEVVGKLKAGNDHFSALVQAIAESDAFQKRRGKRSE